MRSAIVGGLFSILMMSTAHAAATNIALNKPVTTDSSYSASFPAGAVTDGATGDTLVGSTYSYWLASDGVTSSYVTIDLGASYNIASLTVEDTHNQGNYDRGTKAFAVGFGATAAASQAAASSTPVTTGQFSVSDWKNLTDISVAAVGTGRFVTFLALSAYSNTPGDSLGQGTTIGATSSVGLNEIQVFAAIPSAVPEPVSAMILGAGLLSLAGLRFRKS